MSLTRKVAYNTFTQAIGKILYLACSLAIVILITRYLGVSGYGNYNTVIAYLGFFTTLADLGLWMIMVREISQNPKDKQKIVGNVIGLRIFTAIIALVLASLIAHFLNYPQLVKTGILIFSVGIFFQLLNQVILGVFQIYLRADKAAISEILGRALTLVLIIWLIKIGAGFLLIITASAAGFTLNFIINIILARKYLKIIPQFEFVLWKQILRAAIPVAIVGILTTIYYKIDTVMLSLLPLTHVIIPSINHLTNPEAVGIYGVAYRVLDIVLVFPALFVGLIYPLISKHISINSEKTQNFFQRSFDFLLIFGTLISTVTFFLAPQIIDVIGGKQFGTSISILRILSIAFLPFFIGNLPGNVLVAAHKQKVLILPFFIFALMNIIANLIFIPYYSFFGAAWITTIGHFIVCIIAYILVWKHTNLIPSLKILPKVIIAGIFAGSLIYLVEKYNLLINWKLFLNISIFKEMFFVLILILAVSGIYLLILYILKGISKEDFLVLIRK
jgi:O-antigen/teichoic acid export membrane protein